MWIALSAIGLVLVPVGIAVDEEPARYLLVAIPILAILADVYWDVGEKSSSGRYAPHVKYAIALVSIVSLGYLWGEEEYFQHLLGIPVIMIVIAAMYMLDMIRGGADAKALMALSIVFPFYPRIAGLPFIEAETESLEILFPFSFTVLINAAIVMALVPVVFFVKNAVRGDIRFPQMFLGYRTGVEDVRRKQVWLMERMESDSHVVFARPRRDEDLEKELTALAGSGHQRIWITPKLPFIVPMFFSLFLSAAFGNLLLAAFSL